MIQISAQTRILVAVEAVDFRNLETFHTQSLPLQLALDLGHRQRGFGQSRHSSSGRRPLGPRS